MTEEENPQNEENNNNPNPEEANLQNPQNSEEQQNQGEEENPQNTKEEIPETTQKIEPSNQMINEQIPPGKIVAKIKPDYENYEMYIKDPKIVGSGIKNFVQYILTGKALNGAALPRRYSDFWALRQKLCARWPGVYIPGVPPKKVSGNTDDTFVKSRERLINVFCEKIYKYKFLVDSDELKLFISNKQGVAAAIEKLPNLKYNELLEKYKIAFPEFYEAYDLILGKQKINEFLAFLKKALVSVRNFKNIIADTVAKKTEEIANYALLITTLQDYEKTTLMAFADNNENKMIFYNPSKEIESKIEEIKTKLINPYIDLSEWLEGEEIEIEAIIEGINSFVELTNNHVKLSEKCESIEKDINDLKYGKKSIGSLFSFKNKESALTELESSKKKTEEEIEMLHDIIRYAAFNMESFLEVFKEDKLKIYYIHLKIYSTLQDNNNATINSLWQSVSNDQNMKDFTPSAY